MPLPPRSPRFYGKTGPLLNDRGPRPGGIAEHGGPPGGGKGCEAQATAVASGGRSHLPMQAIGELADGPDRRDFVGVNLDLELVLELDDDRDQVE
jgi:hypothetical protein